MKRHFLILLIIFYALKSFGQSKTFERTDEYFAFIENNTDTSSLKLVKTYNFNNIKIKDIENIFFNLKIDARNLDANCYKLIHLSKDTSSKTISMNINTYLASDSILNINFKNHEKNTVYIFPDKNSISDIFSFKLNNKNKIIKNQTYLKYVIPKNYKAKINKGGFTGLTVIVTWGINKTARYFVIKENAKNKLKPKLVASPYGGIGLSFSKDSNALTYFDNDLSRLLVLIYKELN
ncbi:MAG TPA: hypothetical protein PKK00_05545 [Bacteroidales bacterium]|nr:hypothetical protein [Bacteroidales bacterium]HPS16373.1 hypothetical protein [Bacteroidales bacterium]